jgi:Uma2 family endonuclease
MIQRTRDLVDELARVEGKAEIVGGEIVCMSPAGGLHGIAAGIIFTSLKRHQKRHGGGTAFPDNVGFIVDLPDRESFSPDVAWHPIDSSLVTEDFVDGAPSFAVEVRSPGDYTPSGELALAAKIKDYFSAGTIIVWDVDLRNEVIRSYCSSEPARPKVFSFRDVADAEPAVSGWRFPAKRLKR